MSTDQHNSEEEGFGLPGGFFGRNAEKLRQRIACMEELDGLTRLQALKEKNPFGVPEGYFGALSLPVFPATLPFRSPEEIFPLPAAYFEKSAAELRTAIGLIEHHTGSGGFEVPVDYFRTSAGSLSDTARGESARVFQLFPPAMRVAVAALLILALGLWIYRYTTKTEDIDCTTIACLEKKDLLGSRVLETLSEEDLMLLIDGEGMGDDLFEDEIDGRERDTAAPAAAKSQADA